MQDSYGNEVFEGEYVYCAYSKENLESPAAEMHRLIGKNLEVVVFFGERRAGQRGDYITSGGNFPFVKKVKSKMFNFRCAYPEVSGTEEPETVEDVALALREVGGMLKLFSDGSWVVLDDVTEEIVKSGDELPILDQLLPAEPESVTLENGREAFVMPRKDGYVGLVQGPEGAYSVYWDSQGWCADPQHRFK